MLGPHRTIVAFLVAPLVAASALAAPAFIIGQADIVVTLGWIFIAYVFCAVPLIIFGTPMYLVLACLSWLNLWSILITGIAIGAISALAVRLPSGPGPRDFELFVSIGALASLVFWAIWRVGRPVGIKAL